MLEKILASEEFATSKTEKKLLAYLVNSFGQTEPPSETSIAIDVYGKDHTFNSSEDPIVRVHMHNLRKKLEKYYLTEGLKDAYRITIPKGGYGIQFIAQNPKPNLRLKINHHIQVILTGVIIFLLIVILYQWLIYKNSASVKISANQAGDEYPLIGDMVQNNLPILTVLGDQIYVQQVKKDKSVWFVTRYPKINSPQELNKFIYEQKDNEFDISRYQPALLEKEIVWALKPLLSIMIHTKKQYDFQLSSDLDWQDVQNNNIIFMGITKTLYIMSSLYHNLQIQYHYAPHYISIDYDTSSTPKMLYPQGNAAVGPRKDYVIVTKIPGPNNNKLLLITGADLTPVLEAVKNLCIPEKFKTIEQDLIKKHGRIPPFLEMVLEVSSINRTGFKTTYIESFEIDATFNLIKPGEITP